MRHSQRLEVAPLAADPCRPCSDPHAYNLRLIEIARWRSDRIDPEQYLPNAPPPLLKYRPTVALGIRCDSRRGHRHDRLGGQAKRHQYLVD